MTDLPVGRLVRVSCLLLLAYLTLIRIEAAHSRAWTHRWVSDDADRDVYYDIAQFLPAGATPYVDVRSEYPPLATMAFAAPLIVAPGWKMDRSTYRFVWSGAMAAVLVATIAVVARFRRHAGLNPAPALLLLLPSPVYFSLMRFDILCVLIVCVSLVAFSRGRYAWAHTLLAAGTFVKWYPAVVFPVYLAYHVARDRARPPSLLSHSETLRYSVLFLGLIGGAIAASIVAFTWDGMLFPYRFHGARGGQYFNLYWLLERGHDTAGIGVEWWPTVNLLFLALQVSIVPLLLFVRVRSTTDVFRYAIVAIWIFITFARIDSPQWMLWYLAPALMVLGDGRALAAAAALAICNYLVFPVAFDLLDTAGLGFSILVLVKDLLAIAVVSAVFREDPLPLQHTTAA